MENGSPQGALAQFRHPEQHHTFVDSGRSHAGSDGRVVRECRICEGPPNAGRHRDPDARWRRSVPKGPRLAHLRRPVEVHPFVLGGPTKPDKRGRTLQLCGDPSCRSTANSPKHRTGVRLARRLGAASPKNPTPRPRAAATVAPAEYVAAAITMDAILALPHDVVPWRLRMRLQAAREDLPVPTYPTLYVAPEPEPEEAPAVVEVPEEEAPRVRPVARDATMAGILRGIRNDRYRSLARRAVDTGWDLSMTGSGHARLSRGDRVLILSTTAGDARMGHSWGNLRAQAKRSGIDVTGL